MNPQKKSTTRQQEQEEQNSLQQAQVPATREFASVDDMLRHDALHTPVPPAIAGRLEQSLKQSPPSPRRPWWRRIFGGCQQ